MTGKLFVQAILKYLGGVVLVGLLLFWPAGTWHYPRGWLLMGLLFVPMFLAGLVMMVKAPDLLKERLNARETESDQKKVLLASSLMFAGGFMAAGFSQRFQWMLLPRGLMVTGAVLFLLAYGLYGEVLRENRYLSRTIKVQEGQTVVDTGLYGVVRHPMYSVTLILFLSMPLILGSLAALVIFLVYPVIIVFRIRNEEQVLEKDLPGYREYQQKVRYRLIPFLW